MPRLLQLLRPKRGGGLARYLGREEEVVLVTRQHPLALVRAALDSFTLIVPLLIATWGIAGTQVLRNDVGTWLIRVAFLTMFALVLRIAWSVLEWEHERVVVTNEKVIHVEGVLQRRIASTPLAKVSEFTVRQPLLGRVFDYGSLVVDVPGGRDQALHGLAFLPDPAGLYRLVSDRGRADRTPPISDADVERIEQAVELGAHHAIDDAFTHRVLDARPDPWAPTLDGDNADHTIAIPRIPPRD